MISKKEKNRRKHTKELKSLKNKLSGPNLVWIESLSLEKQFDFLFMWKKHKYSNKIKKAKVSFISVQIPVDPKRPWGLKRTTKRQVLQYPSSLKHFIKACRLKSFFNASTQRIRNSAIEILLNKK